MRTRLAIFGVLAIGLIATLYSLGGSTERKDRTEPSGGTARPTVVGAAAAPRPEPKPKPRARPRRDDVDPQDHDPKLRARLRASQVTGPAFQHLPYSGHGIVVDFGEAGPDGRVELTVVYLGARASARKALERFLARWHDDGSGYRVTYQRSASGG
jgi:hypothetical protein